MTKLEERAYKAFPPCDHEAELYRRKKRIGYIKGATEQKAIDIGKACEVYETELRQMIRILNEIQDGAGEIISVGGSLTEFRKALEE